MTPTGVPASSQTATLDGRNGAAVTVLTMGAPKPSWMTVSSWMGSRCVTRRVWRAASAHVRKKGATMPVATTAIAPPAVGTETSRPPRPCSVM